VPDISAILGDLDAPFKFRKRPVALPGDLRPDWRLAVLMLILRRCCNNGQSTLRRLHVLNWAIRSSASRDAFLRRLDGENNPDEVLVRYEPALNRAIDLARGLGFMTRVSGNRVRLTLSGSRLADDVDELKDVLVDEKMFLARARGRVTEGAIQKLIKGEA
jgi:hypothetical protein